MYNQVNSSKHGFVPQIRNIKVSIYVNREDGMLSKAQILTPFRITAALIAETAKSNSTINKWSRQ